MSRVPSSERAEIALVLGRLIDALAQVKVALDSHAEAAEVWGDGDHIYLEAALALGGDPDHLDLCLQEGRLFVQASR